MVARRVLGGAYRLDAWLKLRVGRPYTIILGIGLVYGVIGSVRNLTHAAPAGRVAVLIGTTVFQLLLLVNQLGQLHEFREEARARRAERKARRRGRTEGVPPPG